MANRCHVVFAKIKGRSRDDGISMPVMSREIVNTETLTVSGSTATTTITAPTTADKLIDTVADITTEDTVWIAIGATPDPSVNPRWLVLANTSLTLTLEDGDKVACRAA